MRSTYNVERITTKQSSSKAAGVIRNTKYKIPQQEVASC